MMALLVRPHTMFATRPLLFGQTKRMLCHFSLPPQGPSASIQTGIIDSSSHVGIRHGCAPKIKRENHVLGMGRHQPRPRGMGTEAKGHISSQGSIDSSSMHSMQKKIKEQLNAEIVTVEDAYGDGRHVSIYVVSSAFEGQSAVNRQRMVYKAIWEELQETVHAVDRMITMTPSEAAKE
ncbi:hypothetical protein Dimus_034533 [Dionaea muscipula]